MGRAKGWRGGGCREFGFGNVRFKMPIRHQRREKGESCMYCTNLELRTEAGAGERSLGVIGVWMGSKSMRQSPG